MDPQAYLLKSDSILASHIAFDYFADAIGGVQFLTPGMRSIADFCFKKASGSSSMSLNLGAITYSFKFFGQPLQINYIVTFSYMIDPSNPAEAVWSADYENLSIPIPGAPYGATIVKFAGRFTTSLAIVPSSQAQQACDTISRHYDLALGTMGNSNEMAITIQATVPGIGTVSSVAHINNLQLRATAGQRDLQVEQGGPKVTITVVGDPNSCQPALTEGQIATLFAQAHLPQGVNGEFTWTVDPAVQVLTALTSPKIQLKLPSPPPASPVLVKVAVVLPDGSVAQDHLAITVLSEAEAARDYAMCEFDRRIRQEVYRSPPYDPGDPATRTRREDFHSLLSLADRLIEASQSFKHAAANLGRRR